MTTKRSGLMARLRAWLVFQLMRRGIELQVEARHGAFRTRHVQIWKGGLVRVEIPLQRKNGVTDTPMGRISSQTAKTLIDSFTGVEGEDGMRECRDPRSPYQLRTDGRKVCVLCGGEVKDR